MKRLLLLISLIFASGAISAFADSPPKDADKTPPASAADAAALKAQSAVSHGSVTVSGETIKYTATAGTLILKNDEIGRAHV